MGRFDVWSALLGIGVFVGVGAIIVLIVSVIRKDRPAVRIAAIVLGVSVILVVCIVGLTPAPSSTVVQHPPQFQAKVTKSDWYFGDLKVVGIVTNIGVTSAYPPFFVHVKVYTDSTRNVLLAESYGTPVSAYLEPGKSSVFECSINVPEGSDSDYIACDFSP